MAERGIAAGLLAAVLFGASAPISKLFLIEVGPLMLAGLLYLGAGAGLSLYRLAASSSEAPLRRSDAWPLAGIIVTGGILGPVLMLIGLSRVSAVAGSLLLNLEAPLTMVLAVTLFGEHLGRRASLAAGLVVAGGVLLAWRPGELHADPWGAAAIAGACLSWGVDNNLTQRLSLRDPIVVVRIKTLGAGACTLGLALVLGHRLPDVGLTVGALALGGLAYGASIVLDMVALRHLGAAREAATFATAPFIGAALSVPLLGDRLGVGDLVGGVLMAAGVVLLVRERHAHPHTHVPVTHEHAHVHDAHHQHAHEHPVTEHHSHRHEHESLTHTHPHAPDLHHRHVHD